MSQLQQHRVLIVLTLLTASVVGYWFGYDLARDTVPASGSDETSSVVITPELSTTSATVDPTRVESQVATSTVSGPLFIMEAPEPEPLGP
jgi:hypothetical protein